MRIKRHYVEKHIVLSDGMIMSLGFQEVATENAETLLEKTIECIEELTEIHCDGEADRDRKVIFKEVVSKMKCLMSNRAAFMKLFDKKIAEFRKDVAGEDEHTNFLFCIFFPFGRIVLGPVGETLPVS
ncbi:hypothetical protein ElyMa_003897600 [Elysia marginata]|uniref:Uncharacterized protein n=1 Tax=Elysia marginata TaxID=1093978 RepID=A0AAV4FMU3_9GAST|nr:hypothetical protein ElyMa_003897600 [Elysia marginata]